MNNRKNILIVDDIELNRAILCELFHDKYEILEAENGAEALVILEQFGEKITLILLDIIMPVMDGFGMLKAMAKKGFIGRIPVVLITSETANSVVQAGYEMGASDVISKPFTPHVIEHRIHNIIEQYTHRLHLEKLVSDQTDILREQARNLRKGSIQMIDILSTVIEFKNSESVNHIQNIRFLTRLLMKQLLLQDCGYDLSDELIEVVSEASAMHDIGKVAIPDSILNKPMKLTAEEFDVMKTHVVRGCEILKKISNVHHLENYDYFYDICRHHHERWDGKGYPDHLIGDETPIWSQVVSLADAYDALTSKRVYKEAYSSDEAVRMIVSGECGMFNPVLVECFLSLIPHIQGGSQNPTPQNPLLAPVMTEVQSIKPIENASARTLRLLELERQKYRIMSELSGEILFEYDWKTDRFSFSEKYHELTGNQLSISNFKNTLHDEKVLPESQRIHLLQEIRKITAANPTLKTEMQINLGGSGFHWYAVYLYPLWDTDYEAKCIGYVGKLIDIDNQKQEHWQLQQAATTDSLTTVLNRAAFQTLTTDLFNRGQIEEATLGFLDIDNFKFINDTFGHPFGDQVLSHLASILKACVRKTDFVGRIGGDEFAVLFSDVISPFDLDRRLCAIFEKFTMEFKDCPLSLSAGIAQFPKHGTDFETLLQRADQALYKSKRLGKGQYQIYEKSNEAPPPFFRSDTTNQHSPQTSETIK